jgi:ABC-type Mn2+/Zn2+ transport system permease subunit
MHDPGAIIAAIAMAIAAGMIGCFAVMRRMALASDAISHVALPGIGVALALGIHPLFGAVAMLAFGALAIWALERRTRIATETIVGVVFSAALAIGSLLSSGDDLIEALFGGRSPVGLGELAFGVAAALAITGFVWWSRNRLVLALVSPEIAMTAGIRVARLDLWFLEAFALTIALGLHYLGVLLMGSMIIIPAATAKRLARNLSGMLAWATAVAVASTAVGTGIAIATARPPGPVIVCVATSLFVLSLVARRA